MATQLNLLSCAADRELDDIRRVLSTFETAADHADVIAVLRRALRRGDRYTCVDMIGHSRSPGFLVVGSWIVDDSPQTAATFSALLRPMLQELGVRVIRLLGCSTATTEHGRKVLRRIAQVARCNVFGTKRNIGKHDYASCGFIADEAIIDGDGTAYAPCAE